MSSLECQVCVNKFDVTSHKPRSLGCGHTICTSCIRELLSGGKDNRTLRCAICRKPHIVSVNRVSEVPINFSLLSLVEGFKNRPRELFLLVKSEAEESTGVHMGKYEEIISQLQALKSQLIDQRNHLVETLPVMPQLMQQLETLKAKLSSELEEVGRRLEQGKQQKRKLEDAQEQVHTADNSRELNTALDILDERQITTNTWSNTTINSINYETVTAAEKVCHKLILSEYWFMQNSKISHQNTPCT